MLTKVGFVENFQKALTALGVQVSNEIAWKIFKATIHEGIVGGVLKDSDNRISLSGIGSFELVKMKPRSTKVGVVDFVPRIKWRPSSAINDLLEEKTGQVPNPNLRAKKRAELEAEGKLTNNLPDKEETPEQKEPEKEETPPTEELDEFDTSTTSETPVVKDTTHPPEEASKESDPGEDEFDFNPPEPTEEEVSGDLTAQEGVDEFEAEETTANAGASQPPVPPDELDEF